MKYATIAVRILLGLGFVVFGLNGFLNFIKPPPDSLPTGDALAFATILNTSHYFYVVAACQLIGGLLLLSGRFVALGLIFLGPVVVNIMVFHICLFPKGLGMASVFAVLTAFLIWAYRERFAPIFKP